MDAGAHLPAVSARRRRSPSIGVDDGDRGQKKSRRGVTPGQARPEGGVSICRTESEILRMTRSGYARTIPRVLRDLGAKAVRAARHRCEGGTPGSGRLRSRGAMSRTLLGGCGRHRHRLQDFVEFLEGLLVVFGDGRHGAARIGLLHRGQRVRRCQDDHGAARSAHPPLPHRRDRERLLPLPAQYGSRQGANPFSRDRPARARTRLSTPSPCPPLRATPFAADTAKPVQLKPQKRRTNRALKRNTYPQLPS